MTASSSAPEAERKQKVAVIGSGIAGLSAAWLTSSKYEVTIYERAAHLGMDAHGVDVPCPDGSTVRVDMPLRVFTESYYPNLSALYEKCEVGFGPEDYSASFSSLRGQSFLRYRNWVWGKISIPYLLPGHNVSWRLLYDVLYFLWQTPRDLKSGRAKQMAADRVTFETYLKTEGYSEEFLQNFILPALAGICTCSFEAVLQYPAHIIIHYLVTRSMKGVRRVEGGAEQVVNTLASKCKEVKLGAGVRSVKSRQTAQGSTEVVVTDDNGEVAVYDHVIISTQANQALRFCKDLDPALRQALRGFPYEKSSLVLHTDESLMPTKKKDWKSVNFILTDPADEGENVKGLLPRRVSDAQPEPGERGQQLGAAKVDLVQVGKQGMATIWMNRVQANTRKCGAQLFQTWNPVSQPDPSKVLLAGEFERPVVTYESLDSMKVLWDHQGKGNVWFCGSYCTAGMPLLETAVSSSVLVARSLGVQVPWFKDTGASLESSVAAATDSIEACGTVATSKSSFFSSSRCVGIMLLAGAGLAAALSAQKGR